VMDGYLNVSGGFGQQLMEIRLFLFELVAIVKAL
jgi:hypothetical protein